MDPEYMQPLFHTPPVISLLFIGLAMIDVGSLVLKKIVSFRG